MLDSFVNKKDNLVIPKGEIIFREGDLSDRIFTLIRGEIELFKNSNLVCNVGKGEVIGEIDLINNKERTFTAIAKSDCELVVMNKQRFEYLLNQTPAFIKQMIVAMASRLRVLCEENYEENSVKHD